ncbi:MAG: HypC/HybG/HupF family hydrogenase formation chaperone [Desulfurococcales archaeon]|jgi:hydrogenase expression/formation protein HypC|nr:HypC/HybG/HupF family hydrogenase formation chaperone [Desulfurococcales archaeon]
MCLGVIGKVVEIDEETKLAKVDVGGAIIQADSSFEDVSVGDYVVVHAGVIISKSTEEDYRLREEIFKAIGY